MDKIEESLLLLDLKKELSWLEYNKLGLKWLDTLRIEVEKRIASLVEGPEKRDYGGEAYPKHHAGGG